MKSTMFFTVIIVNWLTTSGCLAHAISKLPHKATSGDGTKEQELQMIKLLHQDRSSFDDSMPLLPPSPVQQQHQNNPYNLLNPAKSLSKASEHQPNEITETRPPDEIDMIDENTERRIRIEIVKQNILNGLRLAEPPNVTEPVRFLPPQILQSIADHRTTHHRLRNHLEDDPDTTKIFVSADLHDDVQCDFRETAQCFRFHFRQQSRDKKLAAVRLWVYLMPNTNSSSSKRTIVASLPATQYRSRHTLATKDTYVQSGWVEIDLPPQRHSMNHFKEKWNYIEITCNPNLPEMTTPVSAEKSFQPILSLTYILKNRARRQSNSRARCNNNCCLRSLTLTFQEIGWHWIQPGTFRADYCTGTCPTNRPILTSGRTQLMTTFTTRTQNVQGVPTPCCVPTSYGNLTVFYRDSADDSLQQQVLLNIRAMSCGCVI